VILAVTLGVLIGLSLGALGAGGSVLAVPVLVYIAGKDLDTATSVSLVAVGAAAAVATVGHARAGRVRWDAAIQFVAMGAFGSWFGTVLHRKLDEDLTLLMFAVLVLVAAYRMLTACPSCTREGEAAATATATATASATDGGSAPKLRHGTRRYGDPKVLAAGLLVGVLTGLFGVGGGFIIVPALTLALGLNMPTAIATSLAAIVGNALFAVVFRGVGSIDWAVALPFTLAMLTGSALGSRLAPKIPATASLRAFAVILVGVALATGISSAVALGQG
jgi:uncharacterized membrane protein YfcA